MLKWLNKNKEKKNKGFTLVELIIVIAILAILVGILAPQYTKYVERSRKAADVSNLENLVTAVKVATADYQDIINTADKVVVIKITKDDTTITYDNTSIADSNVASQGAKLKEAIDEYAGADWSTTKAKSGSWGDDGIQATCTISKTGSVSVEYAPADVKNELQATE